MIPARGGSKRIPRKNIKEFCGKPMIAYSIQAAINSGLFDKVIASTDDREIADICQSFGCEVPFIRPSALADDFSTTLDVMSHAVNWFDRKGWELEKVCCVYATAPFLSIDDLVEGLSLLDSPQVQYSLSVTRFATPIQRAFRLSKEKKVEMFSPRYESARSQDLEPAYHDAGQFYWGKADAWRMKLPLFSPHSRAVVIPNKRSQDIDTPEDWELAEYLYLALSR